MTLLAIAWRELRSLFIAPFGWVSLAVFQFVAAWLFLARLDLYTRVQPRLVAEASALGITDLVVAPFFAQGALLLLLLTPLVTMRLVSGERQARTLPLLLAAPLSNAQIILGKYLGAGLFGLLLVALLALMPLTLLVGGALDLGKLAAGLLGLLLLQLAMVAIGLMLSALAAQPAAAAVGSTGLLLLLWIADIGRLEGSRGVLTWLSLSDHLKPFLLGLVSTSDAAYYLLVTVACLALATRRLGALRDA